MTEGGPADKEPTRWIESPEAPPELRSLLEAAQKEGPTIVQKTSLAAKLGFPVSGTLGAGGVGMALLGAGLVAVGVGAGVAVWRGNDEISANSNEPEQPSASSPGAIEPKEPAGRPPQASRVEEPLAPEHRSPDDTQTPPPSSESPEHRPPDDTQTPPPSSESPERSAGTTERSSPPRGSAASGKAPSSKPSEVSLIRAARSALQSDPRRALSLTRQHERLYPSGLLVQEREVLAIEALRALGQKGQARDKARSFRQQHPQSAHRPDVE